MSSVNECCFPRSVVLGDKFDPYTNKFKSATCDPFSTTFEDRLEIRVERWSHDQIYDYPVCGKCHVSGFSKTVDFLSQSFENFPQTEKRFFHLVKCFKRRSTADTTAENVVSGIDHGLQLEICCAEPLFLSGCSFSNDKDLECVVSVNRASPQVMALHQVSALFRDTTELIPLRVAVNNQGQLERPLIGLNLKRLERILSTCVRLRTLLVLRAKAHGLQCEFSRTGREKALYTQSFASYLDDRGLATLDNAAADVGVVRMRKTMAFLENMIHFTSRAAIASTNGLARVENELESLWTRKFLDSFSFPDYTINGFWIYKSGRAPNTSKDIHIHPNSVHVLRGVHPKNLLEFGVSFVEDSDAEEAFQIIDGKAHKVTGLFVLRGQKTSVNPNLFSGLNKMCRNGHSFSDTWLCSDCSCPLVLSEGAVGCPSCRVRNRPEEVEFHCFCKGPPRTPEFAVLEAKLDNLIHTFSNTVESIFD